MDTPKIIVHDKVDDSDMVAINMGEEADFPSMIPEEEELSIRVKKSRADRKKGVEMRMMFRDHHDPLYYDAKANDKCFVPVMAMVSVHLLSINTVIGGNDWRATSHRRVFP